MQKSYTECKKISFFTVANLRPAQLFCESKKKKHMFFKIIL